MKKNKRKKNKWRKERGLTNKILSHNQSNSRTGGKEPICTNAQALQWRKSLVSTGGCWSVSVLRLYPVLSYGLSAGPLIPCTRRPGFQILLVKNIALLSLLLMH